MAIANYHGCTYYQIEYGINTDITPSVVFVVTIMWVLIFINLNIAAVHWTFHWASIAVSSMFAVATSPSSVIEQWNELFLLTGVVIFGAVVARSLVGNANPNCWVIEWVLSLKFEDKPTDIFHKKKQFRRTFWIAVIFCTAVIVLVMGIGDIFSNIWIETRYELFFWITTLLLRVFIHGQVREVGKSFCI